MEIKNSHRQICARHFARRLAQGRIRIHGQPLRRVDENARFDQKKFNDGHFLNLGYSPIFATASSAISAISGLVWISAGGKAQIAEAAESGRGVR
jgi:hypothetical protein